MTVHAIIVLSCYSSLTFLPPRPTIPQQAPGDTEGRDFWVDRPAPGVINLLGIESPGLTASLALTEHVMLMGRG